ncbi:hypothetical protein HHO47_13520 [Pseudoalteromonas arctica]|uniref:Uncharacterized protein n=2 Tax=Pseudoalteromonas arctica TaxID=394751 RepID=A0A7Y0DW37_9GAMM|nr:hypothetical protein [Pseudoalteromonas arctica]
MHMSHSIESRLLMSAAVIAFAAAVWHLLCIWGGPSWFAFTRAPVQLIASSKQGTLLAPLGAIVVAGLMFTCSAFALSALKILPKLPFTTVAREYIDVGIIENLLWQVTPINAAPYWQVLPNDLKTLYVNFHQRTPI